MIDPKLLREAPERVQQALKDRGVTFDLTEAIQLEKSRRAVLLQLEQLKRDKNVESETISQLKAQNKPVDDRIQRMKVVSQKERSLELKVGDIDLKLRKFMELIPNIPHSSVKTGGATVNQVVRSWGKPAAFQSKPKTHLALGEHLGLFDFPRAAKITGSHFPLFKGWGAKLERALFTFMLDVHTKEHGYTEIFPPFLVNRASMFGTGQVPKFEEDMYRLKDDDLFLVPTAEVPVTNLHRDEILEEAQLPLKYAAYTACFRREAGSYGKETHGLVRVHQFDKVELVKFATPQMSYEELESLVHDAEVILQRLELHYRVVLLATGELGFAAAKCYDLEAWAPGLNQFLECSSCSNFEEFQARRANIKYRTSTGKLAFVHTLNGSGVALARTLIAFLETHQQPDGRIRIPTALQPYVGAEVLA